MDEQDIVEEREESSGAQYWFALLALLVLTVTSLGLHFANWGGGLGTFVALLIAAIKVTIVAVVFMELRESLPATRLIAVITILFVALLCLGIVGDVAYR